MILIFRLRLEGIDSPVDKYTKGFKNNFFATLCRRSDLLGLYMRDSVYIPLAMFNQNIAAYAEDHKKIIHKWAMNTELFLH